MQLPNIPEVQVGGARSGDGGQGLGEMSWLTDGIHNHHDAIIPSGLRKLRDEANADNVPAVFWNGKRLEFANREAALRFGSEAEVAVSNILADESGHVRPPVIPGDELQCFEAAGVTSYPRVMAERDDSAAEVRGFWDIESSAVVK